jgi:predicted trehalose synthase
VEWPYPFSAIEHADDKSAFEAELRREVKPGHPLFELPVAAIGRRYDQDDVLFEVNDGSGRVAEVHLTWAGEREQPPWPGTALFASFAEWVKSVKEEFSEPVAAPDCPCD